MAEKDSRFSVIEESDQEDEGILALDASDDDGDSPSNKIKKKLKLKLDPEERAGVLYLSSVPDYMTVVKLRNTFDDFGEVGRTFFQPKDTSFTHKKGLLFSEGWVEFKKKKTAKNVAKILNNTQVGGKKKQPWYNCIWNIKYLKGFTWTDVNRDRELKKATYDSRIRTEIRQAKKQADYYTKNHDKSKNLQQMKARKEKAGQVFDDRMVNGIKQNLTTDEHLANKKDKKRKSEGGDKSYGYKKVKQNNEASRQRDFVMKNLFS